MIIRKKFSFEGSHRVLDCTADRCKKSFHGHSYIVELFLKSKFPDNAGMVCDFHLLNNIKRYIDSFDHTCVFNINEPESVKNFLEDNNERWIELNFNPSAENFAAFFHYMISNIIHTTKFENKEDPSLEVLKVRVHETATGYAETENFEDVVNWLLLNRPLKVRHSAGVIRDWNSELLQFIQDEFYSKNKSNNTYFFKNPIITK